MVSASPLVLPGNWGLDVPRKNHFDKFGDHTALKHFLLEAYLKRWAIILLGRFPNVWFVDAFAGPGHDDQGHPGSPVLAATIAGAINLTKSPRVMHVVAIEKNPRNHKKLAIALRAHTDQQPPRVHVRHGTLETFLDRILDFIKGAPALFFLDPFGIDGLDRDVVAKALGPRHNELFVLFSDEGANRLHGKVVAEPPDLEKIVAGAAAMQSLLGPEFDEETVAAVRRDFENCIRGHKSSPRARAILDRAFGDNGWQAVIDATPSSERQERFVDLYETIVLRGCGATHVLRFRVATAGDQHKYYLLHASKSPAAFRAMKEAIAHVRRTKMALQPTLLSAEFLTHHPAKVLDGVLHHFAGREVCWSIDHGDDTVGGYLMYKSQLCPDEFPWIKKALIQRGLAVKSNGKLVKPERFAFPPRGF